jgi:hypothetical protein
MALLKFDNVVIDNTKQKYALLLPNTKKIHSCQLWRVITLRY